MLDTVMTLCCLSGVSGAEDEVRDYILERIMPFADKLGTDSMGNIIAFKKGAVTPAQRLMLCAHMDEVGLIVTGYNDDGSVRFDTVGGINRTVLIGKKVFIGPQRVAGFIGNKAYHLVDKSEEKDVPAVDKMYIEIGCTSQEEAEKAVSLGDRCVFDDSVVEFGDGYLKAKALDDRVGCAAMIKLIESDLPCDTYFVFTVQEEVGCRGAAAAAFRIAPDVTLVMEGTTATDLPEIEDGKRICTAGKGVVIPFMDGGTLYAPVMYKRLTSLAEANGTQWQTKRRIAGGTDASAVQRSRAGVLVGGIACAVRNIHSHASVIKISECEDMLRLAKAFLKDFAENGIG